MNTFELAPAQILFLMQPSKVKVYSLLEATLQDLVLRKIVRVEQIQSYPNPRSRKTQTYFMLRKGSKFEGYEPTSFEKGFLIPLTDHDKLMTKLVTDYILKKYSMPASFINEEIYVPLSKEKYISGLPILKAFGVYSLSNKAKSLLGELNKYMEEQTEKLKENLNNYEAFYSILVETGWFVFLIKHHNLSLYKEIVSVTKKIRRNHVFNGEKSVEEFLEAFEIKFEMHE